MYTESVPLAVLPVCQKTISDDLDSVAPMHTTPHSQIRHAVTEGIHVVEQFIFHYLQGLNSIILTIEIN